MPGYSRSAASLAAGLILAATVPGALLAHGDEPEPEKAHQMLDEMRELHKGHAHEHDFEAMEQMSHDDMEKIMETLVELGLAVPPMDASHGKEVFLDKGCIVCHQVNGIGGDMGPPLDAKDMPPTMSAFEFAARMWRGAATMIAVQDELFGGQIELTGQDLADLIAFVHDEHVQSTLKPEDIPQTMREMIP